MLSDVLRAMRDENTTIKIATINSGSEWDKLPSKWDVKGNQIFADSVSLGNGITMRRIYLPSVKSEHGYEMSRGFKWVVITPNGEAEFNQDEWKYSDFGHIWGSVLRAYVDQEERRSTYNEYLYDDLTTPELKKIYGGPSTKKISKQDKLKAAKEKMHSLGVEKTKHLDALMAKLGQHENI